MNLRALAFDSDTCLLSKGGRKNGGAQQDSIPDDETVGYAGATARLKGGWGVGRSSPRGTWTYVMEEGVLPMGRHWSIPQGERPDKFDHAEQILNKT